MEIERKGLPHIGIQGQQTVVLTSAGLIEHGVAACRRQPDGPIGVNDGVIDRIGAQAPHRIAEIDLVACHQCAQTALAIVHDKPVLKLEAARAHGAEGGRGPRNRRHALAPVAMIFGGLRLFLLDYVVIDRLVAYRLQQARQTRRVQNGGQEVGVIGLPLQLSVQGQHLLAQAARCKHVLRLKHPCAYGKHAAQICGGKTREQLGRNPGIGKERLGQCLALRRLHQQGDLLMQHGLFLGDEQANGVAIFYQHVIGNIVLQADRRTVFGLYAIQVNTVVVRQIAIAGHIALGIEQRHDIQAVQLDDVIAGNRSACRRGVQKPDRHRAGRCPR